MSRKKPHEPNVPKELLSLTKIPDFAKKAKNDGLLKNSRNDGLLKNSRNDDLFEMQAMFDSGEAEFYQSFMSEKTQANFLKLVKHYGLDIESSSFWKDIAFKVIFDFVPVFQVEKEKIGRPQKWDQVTLYELWFEVDRMVRNEGHKAISACSLLAEQEKWAAIIERVTVDRSIADNLYDVYMEAQRLPIVKVVKNIRSSQSFTENYSGDIAEDFLNTLKSKS